jgi:hypothetical protein
MSARADAVPLFFQAEVARHSREEARKIVLDSPGGAEEALDFLFSLELSGLFRFYRFDAALRSYANRLRGGAPIPTAERPVVAKHVSRYAHVLARHGFRKVS